MPGRANGEHGPGLESVLGRPDFQIPGHRLVAASGDILYAWTRGGAPLYIGMSSIGLLRPLSRAHDVVWALREGDQLWVWRMGSREEARHQERRAIRRLAPRFNVSIADRPQRGEAEPLVEEVPAPTEAAAQRDERGEPENLSFPW
jgi:hypothetical protein